MSNEKLKKSYKDIVMQFLLFSTVMGLGVLGLYFMK